mmetsp:Transcript_2419/g.3339  ORF Transcript_2419/g.3339 Transcript_2419/m.3339 type:complete len:81 (+) Transcript_2419:1039-1281(+)
MRTSNRRHMTWERRRWKQWRGSWKWDSMLQLHAQPQCNRKATWARRLRSLVKLPGDDEVDEEEKSKCGGRKDDNKESNRQ